MGGFRKTMLRKNLHPTLSWDVGFSAGLPQTAHPKISTPPRPLWDLTEELQMCLSAHRPATVQEGQKEGVLQGKEMQVQWQQHYEEAKWVTHTVQPDICSVQCFRETTDIGLAKGMSLSQTRLLEEPGSGGGTHCRVPLRKKAGVWLLHGVFLSHWNAEEIKKKKKKKETAKYFALIWRGRSSKHFSVLSLLLLPARHAHHTRSSAIGKLREAETAPSNHQHLLTQACRVSSAKKAAREEHVTMKWKLICCNVIFYQKKITEQGPSFGTITQKPLCWQPWQSAGLHGLPYGDTCHAKCWLELKWKRHPACIALPLILTPNILCWQWAFAGGAWRDTFCFCLFVCSSAIIEAYVVLNRRITMNYKLLCISDRRQDLCTATHGTLRAQLHKILPRLCLQEIFAATWRNITVSLVKYLMQVPANQVPALRCYWLNHNCVHTWCSQKQHG